MLRGWGKEELLAGQEWEEIRLAGVSATNPQLAPALDLVFRMNGTLRGAEQFCLCLKDWTQMIQGNNMIQFSLSHRKGNLCPHLQALIFRKMENEMDLEWGMKRQSVVSTLSNLSLPNTREFSSSFRRELVEAVLSYEMLKGSRWNSHVCTLFSSPGRKQNRLRAGTGTGPGGQVALVRKGKRGVLWSSGHSLMGRDSKKGNQRPTLFLSQVVQLRNFLRLWLPEELCHSPKTFLGRGGNKHI